MRRDRICARLPIGATIEYGSRAPVWWKIDEDRWNDGTRDVWTNRQMDDALGRGAEVITVDKELQGEMIIAADLEEGDYVVTRFGFWWGGDEPTYSEEHSQMLWRVAGWTNVDGNMWTLVLDAPEGQMLTYWWSETTDPDELDCVPLQVIVDPRALFFYVTPGQDHPRWDDGWDWTYGYEFVEPPEVP